jgi:5-methylcytosine-specific restriction enzyme subunit McrC
VIDPIVLREYEDQPVELTQEDAAFLVSRLGGRIDVRRSLWSDAYILNSRQHIGLVTLPSERRLECHPKVPARNLFVMLAAAFDLPDPFLDAPAVVDRLEDILHFIVNRFAGLVEELLDRGAYRSYVEEEDNLAFVRGRIMVADDLRQNSILRQRTLCRYAEYSWDVPENRVIRQVVQLLVGSGLQPDVIRRLRRLDGLLEEVSPGRFTAADLDGFVYHRLNEEYRPIHRLCRLFLEAASPSETTGAIAFDAFLFDMNRLFESYVTQVIRERAPIDVEVRAQRIIYLDENQEIELKPDIVFRWRGKPVLVADCKYKRLVPGQHVLADLYQTLAYCTALKVQHGLLIYPRHLAPISSSLLIRGQGVIIQETTIDLDIPFEGMQREGDLLALQAFQLGGGSLSYASSV